MNPETIRTYLVENPGQMTVQVARHFHVSEAEVVRLLPAGQAVELDPARWQDILQSHQAAGDVHVLVTNACATLEVTGTFGNFSEWGEFFNVQTKTLDMHIRGNHIGSIFAVTRPTARGTSTLGFLFFDKSGTAAFKVYWNFGGSEPAPGRQSLFDQLRDQFRLATRSPMPG